MDDETELLKQIKTLVSHKRYRIRIHAVRHMIEEGFSENDIIDSITGESKLLENYPNELRCLILGYFFFAAKTKSALHSVCDYSSEERVDIVTAYIPQKPWWATPTRRGRVN